VVDDPTRRIADNPEFAELKKMADGMEAICKYVLPVLSAMGLFKGNVADLRAQVRDLRAQQEDFIHLPDRFNSHFAERGWVAYESLNMDLMRKAVELADHGNMDAAEAELVSHYDEETLDFKLRWLRGLPCFEPRMDLLSLAKVDYLEGRYHASVPVVLAMIDGAANDLGHVGFFAEGAQLQAENSIAGHVSGIECLARTFGKTRRKTNADPLPVPYRNGILHGVDLGYARQDIAAKCWAALFAVADWARARETPYKPREEKTFRQALRQRAETQKMKKQLNDWRPRTGTIPADAPIAASADCPQGTPEHAAAHFLEGWRTRNFGKMAALLERRKGMSRNAAAGEIRKDYDGFSLIEYRLMSVQDDAAAISVIDVEADVKTCEEVVTTKFQLRMIFKGEDDRPAVRGGSGQWFIVHDPIWKVRGQIFWGAQESE